MFSCRDFLLNFYHVREKDGTLIHMTVGNHETEHQVPKSKGVVRGFTEIGGYIITPDPANPNHSIV